MTTDTVTRLLDAVAQGAGIPSDLYDEGAVLDATVPHWRLEAHGPAAIAAQLSSWFNAPGSLHEVQRTPLPTGELVRFSHSWTENGQPMGAHQVHVLDLQDGRITHQEVWCGGRWQASLLAEIEAGLQLAREEV